ncbi:MAG: PQQ-binding-like beta-propeller repeat protein [bacterium]
MTTLLTASFFLIFNVLGVGEQITQHIYSLQDQLILSQEQLYSYPDNSDGAPCTPMDHEYYRDCQPQYFTTDDGMKGWKITLPEQLPLATPAYYNGKLYLGGGFGSYSFYALDADRGTISWAVNTGDDGPTAAVVDQGIVVFNTESCIIYALRASDGKDLWHHWLGDPLMSQPAISGRKVLMAYPGERGHMLICLDLFTGETYWKHHIVSDIISAPVIDKDEVYLASFDGMIYCYSLEDGDELWRENYNATSAPWIFGEQVYTSLRQNEQSIDEHGNEIELRFEGVGILSRMTGNRENDKLFGYQQADYLHADRTSTLALEQAQQDASVGFSTAPSTAQLDKAEENTGVFTVSGAWSYQGSRPVIYDQDCFNAQGNILQRTNPDNGEIVWKWEYTGDQDYGRQLTPPAIVNNKIFIGSNSGEIICIDAESGEELWKYNCGNPIVFQPSVMDGKVFWATANGKVFCLDTGDRNNTGWAMWGGNAAHNGWVEE